MRFEDKAEQHNSYIFV